MTGLVIFAVAVASAACAIALFDEASGQLDRALQEAFNP